MKLSDELYSSRGEIVVGHSFSGSAICIVDKRGRLRLPEFIRVTLRRRSDSNMLMIAPHESDCCLVGYNPGYAVTLYAEQERLRLKADTGINFDARARRMFGRVELAPWASDGSIELPIALRLKSGILDRALFVGTAGMFEIWDPRRAVESGDAALGEIAAWRVQPDLPRARQEA